MSFYIEKTEHCLNVFLLFARYPGVQVDVLTTERGKQTYELNKNVRWANVYDPDDHWPEPAEYTDMIGLLKVLYLFIITSFCY